MRIAYVCADSGVDAFGSSGSSIHVQEVVRAFQARGARVEIFARRLGSSPPPGLEAVVAHRLGPRVAGATTERERAALAANADFLSALRQSGPFNLVYERYSLWNYAAMEYAREAGTPGLLEVNAPLIEEQAEYRVIVDRVGAERVAARVFHASTALIAVSREVAAYLGRHEAARGRVHVVPNGVNPDRFPVGLEPVLPAPPGTFTVGFVGTLKPWHGLDILVRAFGRLHERDARVRLLVVGDGPERDNLIGDLTTLGLTEAAHLTGTVTPAQVPGLLASMDVAVCPYPQRRFYFSPLKVYEFMAAGLPVVASRIGQLGELIEHEVTGLLCPPGDATVLADALDRLRRDPELRRRLGQAARATAIRDHTWGAVVDCVLDLAGLGPPARRSVGVRS